MSEILSRVASVSDTLSFERISGPNFDPAVIAPAGSKNRPLQLSSRCSMTQRLRTPLGSAGSTIFTALVCSILVGMGSILLAPPAAAQDPSPPPTLIKHLRTELQSTDAMRLNMALVDVVMLARCTASCTVPLVSVRGKEIRITNESGTGGVVDLDALTPDLIEVYKSGPVDGLRLMALSALISIGNQQALEQVIEVSSAQSPDVKRTTDRTLAAFYLEKYPDLMERAQRTKTLRIVDIQRAERMRVKAERTGASE